MLDEVQKRLITAKPEMGPRDLMISSTFSPTSWLSAGATNSRFLIIWCWSIILPSQVLEMETINNMRGKRESKAKYATAAAWRPVRGRKVYCIAWTKIPGQPFNLWSNVFSDLVKVFQRFIVFWIVFRVSIKNHQSIDLRNYLSSILFQPVLISALSIPDHVFVMIKHRFFNIKRDFLRSIQCTVWHQFWYLV